MTFRPSPGEELIIGDQIYRIAEHPAAPGMAYGQTGRRGTVYQLMDTEGEAWALKVFQRQYREPRLAGQAERIRDFASYPGLRACERKVLTSTQYVDLIREHMELAYAVLMPWIPGKTWMEVIVGEEVFSPEESLGIVRSLLHVLAKMEERGMAHCDLSGPNLILTPYGAIELVDLEEMYSPDLVRPAALPGGSPGYAHKTAPEGLWRPEADRFAGAVMICEMLGWSDAWVRKEAWGEGYFKPSEMQTNCERFLQLKEILTNCWGGGLATLYEVAWFSDTLLLCPTFTEWLAVLPEKVPEEPVQTATKIEFEKPLVSEPFVEDVEKSVAEEIGPSKDEALEELDWTEEPVDLVVDEMEAIGATWACPVCGKQVAESMELCPYCEQGTPLLLEEGILEPVTATMLETEAEEIQVTKRILAKALPWVGGGVVVLGVILGVLFGFGGRETPPTSTPDQESTVVGALAGSASSTLTATVVVPSATFEPTDSPTIVPSATSLPDFPVRMGTPIPAGEVITTENVQDLEPLAILSYGLPRDMAFSPDGSELAIATGIGIFLLDSETLSEKKHLPSTSVKSVAWSGDGRYLAASTLLGEVIVWNAYTAEQLWIFSGHSDASMQDDLTIGPDGEWLVDYTEDATALLVWDLESGELLKRLEYPCDARSCLYTCHELSTSAEGNILVSNVGDAYILWDTSSWNKIKTLQVAGDIEVMSLSPDEEFLFVTTSAAGRTTHRILDTNTGQVIHELGSTTKEATYSTFSPNGKYTAVVYVDGNVDMWDVSSGKLQLHLEREVDESIAQIKFSPDEELFTTVDSSGLHLWSIAEANEINNKDDLYWSAAFAPGTSSVFLGGNDGVISKVDLPILIPSQTYNDQEGIISSLFIVPDGTLLISYAGNLDDPNITAYQVSSEDPVWSYSEFPLTLNDVGEISYDPFSQLLGVSWAKWGPELEGGVVEAGLLLDALNGSFRRWISTGFNVDGNVNIDPLGRYLAISIYYFDDKLNYTYAARVLSLDDFSSIGNVVCGVNTRWWTHHITGDITFDADGEDLIISCEKRIRIFSIGSWEEVTELETNKYIKSLAISPAGSLMATSGGILSVSDWSFLREMDLGDELLFSPDGRYLLSLSNGSAVLWGIRP